ncbi:hypothetical protein GOP47_0022465 [Adiantum capillus-veneris]|uniref:CASP-like protein n=1 Tax=Adiantum capillus-veneris TaxID=13818 RepID=A0A9D4U5F4_ADICA|nr:hypothetical protein GOP47_0022465 [Adiantum capillus-veneris]
MSGSLFNSFTRGRRGASSFAPEWVFEIYFGLQKAGSLRQLNACLALARTASFKSRPQIFLSNSNPEMSNVAMGFDEAEAQKDEDGDGLHSPHDGEKVSSDVSLPLGEDSSRKKARHDGPGDDSSRKGHPNSSTLYGMHKDLADGSHGAQHDDQIFNAAVADVFENINAETGQNFSKVDIPSHAYVSATHKDGQSLPSEMAFHNGILDAHEYGRVPADATPTTAADGTSTKQLSENMSASDGTAAHQSPVEHSLPSCKDSKEVPCNGTTVHMSEECVLHGHDDIMHDLTHNLTTKDGSIFSGSLYYSSQSGYMKNVALMLRFGSAIFSLIAFSVIVSNSEKRVAAGSTFYVKFSDYQAYNGQLILMGQGRTGGILSSPIKWGASLYSCDQVLAFLMMSSSSSAATASELSQHGLHNIWPPACSTWKLSLFCTRADVAVGMSFVSCLFMFLSTFSSGYHLANLLAE